MFNILNYILVESENHPVYQKEIEEEFGLRPSTATETLKNLEQAGLICRKEKKSGSFGCFFQKKVNAKCNGIISVRHIMKNTGNVVFLAIILNFRVSCDDYTSRNAGKSGCRKCIGK